MEVLRSRWILFAVIIFMVCFSVGSADPSATPSEGPTLTPTYGSGEYKINSYITGASGVSNMFRDSSGNIYATFSTCAIKKYASGSTTASFSYGGTCATAGTTATAAHLALLSGFLPILQEVYSLEREIPILFEKLHQLV